MRRLKKEFDNKVKEREREKEERKDFIKRT